MAKWRTHTRNLNFSGRPKFTAKTSEVFPTGPRKYPQMGKTSEGLRPKLRSTRKVEVPSVSYRLIPYFFLGASASYAYLIFSSAVMLEFAVNGVVRLGRNSDVSVCSSDMIKR